MGPHFCSDPAIKLTAEAQKQRGNAVEAPPPGSMPGRVVGCHGYSPIMRALSYLDYNNFWIIPMAHALLYGVVKGFWKLILSKPEPGVPLTKFLLKRHTKQLARYSL